METFTVTDSGCTCSDSTSPILAPRNVTPEVSCRPPEIGKSMVTEYLLSSGRQLSAPIDR